MDAEERLAGDYVAVMLAAIALWIGLVAASLAIGGYVLTKLL